MKKQKIKISNPDEINKHLQHTSPATWIILGLVTILVVSFFIWSALYKLTIKIIGKADITSGSVTLHIKDADLNKLAVGQKVYIKDKEGKIISFLDEQPVVSSFDLIDGEYTYKVVIKEMKPIDFLFKK